MKRKAIFPPSGVKKTSDQYSDEYMNAISMLSFKISLYIINNYHCKFKLTFTMYISQCIVSQCFIHSLPNPIHSFIDK